MKPLNRMEQKEKREFAREIHGRKEATYEDYIKNPSKKAKEVFQAPAYSGTKLGKRQEKPEKKGQTYDSWQDADIQTPVLYKWVLVKVKRHKWISDYDNDYVPEEEKTVHPEHVFSTMGRCKGRGKWEFIDLEDTEYPDVFFNDWDGVEDLDCAKYEVLAWRDVE